MAASRLCFLDVQLAVDERIDTPRLGLADIAEALGVATRTVQRACGPAGFSALLAERRCYRAQQLLRKEYTVEEAASAVGLSRGRLSDLFLQQYGIRPHDLRVAAQRSRIIGGWKDRGLPDPRGRWYYAQRTRWLRFSREIEAVARSTRPGTELATFLQDAADQAQRPDHRKAGHREAHLRLRYAQRKRRDGRLRAMLEWAAGRSQEPGESASSHPPTSTN